MAETGWRRGPADSGGRTGLRARLGSGELSLVDPMGPPPSVVTRRGIGPEVTPDRLGLSSPTPPWRASDEGPGQGRHGVAPWASGGWRVLTVAAAATDCPAESTPPGPGLPCPRACRLRLSLDGTGSIGAYWIIGSKGGILLNWGPGDRTHNGAMGQAPERSPMENHFRAAN
jgi:hypothetical protein